MHTQWLDNLPRQSERQPLAKKRYSGKVVAPRVRFYRVPVTTNYAIRESLDNYFVFRDVRRFMSWVSVMFIRELRFGGPQAKETV